MFEKSQYSKNSYAKLKLFDHGTSCLMMSTNFDGVLLKCVMSDLIELDGCKM